MMWLNDGMRGRADKTSRTYTKVNKITGRTYAVTLRNPVSSKDFNNNQIKANNKFGALCMGISAWLRAAKAADASAEDKAQLEKFQKALKSQNHYPTVRSLIMGKRYATINEALSAVTIADGEYTKTVEFTYNARPLIEGNEDPDFGGENGSSGSRGSNGSSQGGTTGGDNGGNTGGDPNPNPDGPSE